MDVSKTLYDDSLQVRVTLQTGSSIERDNFSKIYLSNGDNLNPNFFLHLKDWKMNDLQLNMEVFIKPLLFRDFLSLSELSRQPYKTWKKTSPLLDSALKNSSKLCIAFIKKNFTTLYLMICDFSKKNLIRKISKTSCSGKKNGGQIQTQHKRLLWKWHISFHEHIDHFCWPVIIRFHRKGHSR